MTHFHSLAPRPTTRLARWWGAACLGTLLLCLTPTLQAQGPSTARLDQIWQFPQRSAPAQVVARNESRLSAEVSGTVQRWSADVGATVARGEILVQLDPTDLQLRLQRAEAALAAAQARLQLAQAQQQRARELVAQGFFSQEALAQRDTDVMLQEAETRSARLQVDTARRDLAKTTVRAPFAGTVLQRMAQLGEAVQPGGALLVLAETQNPELQAQVVPAELDGLRRSAAMRFEPEGSHEPAVAVKLLRVAAAVQASSRTQTVRLGLLAGSEPPPGTQGVLRWQDPTPHLPARTVVKRGTALGVFVREGQQARFVPLPEAQEGRMVATRLPPETEIVVQGQAALSDGQRID
jgi:RND family efflux transporter MFP subunit